MTTMIQVPYNLQESINAYRASVEWVHQHQHAAAFLASVYLNAWDRGRTVYLCGNGGSAADAQHVAAEYVGRFLVEGRRPLRAIALTTDTSILTALGNDYGYDDVFRRQLEAHVATDGDDAVIFHSTSGKSRNLVAAATWLREHRPHVVTVALLGRQSNCGHSPLAAGVRTSIFCECPDGPSTQITHMMLQHLAAEIVDHQVANKDRLEAPPPKKKRDCGCPE